MSEIIREGRGDDMGAVADLWLALVAVHREIDARLPGVVEGGEEEYAETAYLMIQRGAGQIFVAVDLGGEIVGYVFGIVTSLAPSFFSQKPVGVVVDLYVKPGIRRQGVGSGLYWALLGWFGEQDIETVTWDVAAANVGGRAFWKRMGGDDMMIRMAVGIGG